MKFIIKNRWSGGVQLIIEGDTYALALSVAVKSGADLHGADLYGANLYGADLHSADLSGADLSGTNLHGANLRSANLSGINLRNADLYGANLRNADLSGANLRNANLRGADLYSANLSGANLLCYGDMKRIKTLQIDTWQIAYTKTHIQIGCQRHEIKKWFKFTNKEISNMSCNALTFWKVFKPVLKELIKNSPAQ